MKVDSLLIWMVMSKEAGSPSKDFPATTEEWQLRSVDTPYLPTKGMRFKVLSNRDKETEVLGIEFNLIERAATVWLSPLFWNYHNSKIRQARKDLEGMGWRRIPTNESVNYQAGKYPPGYI